MGDADSPRRSDGACDCGMYRLYPYPQLAHRRGRSRLSVCVQPWETCGESSRLRRCDLVRITCQIPDRDVMRRSTIDVPLAWGPRDGGDGGRLSKHHPPSTLGINPGSLRSTHVEVETKVETKARPSVMARTWGAGCAVAAPRWKHIGLYRVEVYTPSISTVGELASSRNPSANAPRESDRSCPASFLLLSSYTQIQTRRLIYIVPPRGQHQPMIDLGHAVAWTGTSTPPNPRDARALGPPKARSKP